MEQTPASVLATAKQVGAAPPRWTWVEPSVWTERMLTKISNGLAF